MTAPMLAFMLAIGTLVAAGTSASIHAQSPTPLAAEYRPAAGALVPRRVSGTLRGGSALPAVLVLVPDHLALTHNPQPTLYWYLSGSTDARVDVALVDPRRSDPLLETRVATTGRGVHAFDLARAGLTLEPGVEYEWSVALVPDPAQRSKDVVAGGALMHVAAPTAVRQSLEGAAREHRPTLLAAAGLWIDALAELSSLIAASPSDRELRSARARLFEQIGLADVAAFERAR